MRIQICSVAPVPFFIERHGYNFSMHLGACLPPQEYTSFWVSDCTDKKLVYNGGWISDNEKELIPVVIPANEIVADLFHSDQLKEKGCFVPSGDTPTSAELQAAHSARVAHLQREVELADKVYGQLGPAGLPQISDYAKRCAVELGLDVAWVVTMRERKVECRGCGEQIKPNVAVCKSCGAIHNKELAIELGIIGPGPGRPRKEKNEEVAA